ncbi:MAG: hypothetical protein WC891_01945 [Actinomycetota bacterium]
MHINKPLNNVLGNETRIEILRTFFKYPGEFTGRQVARLCELPHATVHKQLDVLSNSKVLLNKHVARSKIYSLNRDSVLYSVLENLFKQESTVRQTIKSQVEESIKENQRLRNDLVHASIYGSMIAGKESVDSDIDVFLVLKDAYDHENLDRWKDQIRTTITTISGTQMHPFTETISHLPKLNKATKQGIMQNSELVYGKTLDDMEKKWQRNQKQERQPQVPKRSS